MNQLTIVPEDEFPPAEAWAEFVKMRKQIKKPLTAYAEKLMLKRLRAMVDNGQHAKSVLDQSIMNSWQNIYEVKTEQATAGRYNAPKLALVDQQQANSAEAMRLLDQANFDAMRTIDEAR